MKISIKKFIVPEIPFAVLLLSSCLVLWVLSYITIDSESIFPLNKPGLLPIDAFIADNSFIFSILSVFITLVNAFLLVQLNTKFSLIRTRTFLPVLIYVLLISVWSSVNISVTNQLTLTLIIMSLFAFMNMYRNTQAVEQAFVGSLLIGISSYFSPILILLLPAFWIGFVLFQSMSLRTFLASLFGLIVPWIFYLSVRLYLQPDALWLNEILHYFDITFVFRLTSIHKIIYLALLLVIFLFGMIGFFGNLHNDSIQTRQRLKLFVYLFIVSIILILIFSEFSSALLPVIALCYAVLISHSFSLQKSNFNSIIFISLLVINVLYVILNYYISTQ